MDFSQLNARLFEEVFGRMVATFAAELATGRWSIFKTEKHIIMEISSAASSADCHAWFPTPLSPRASSSPEVRTRSSSSSFSAPFKLESVQSVTLQHRDSPSPETTNGFREATPPPPPPPLLPRPSSPPMQVYVEGRMEEPDDEALDESFSIVPESSFPDLDLGQARRSISPRSPARPSTSFSLPSTVTTDADDHVVATSPVVVASPSLFPPPCEEAPPPHVTPRRLLHPMNKAKCPQCLKTFANTRHLTRHVKAVHLGLKHKCPYCGGLYARADGLRNHVNSIHLNGAAKEKNPVGRVKGGGDGGKRGGGGENGAEGSGENVVMGSHDSATVDDDESPSDLTVAVQSPLAPGSTWSDGAGAFPGASGRASSPKNRHHRQPRQESVSAKEIVSPDGQSSRFQCPYCHLDDLGSCDELQRHLKESHRGKIHLCHVCLTLFLSPWKLNRHAESHRKKGGGVVGGSGYGDGDREGF